MISTWQIIIGTLLLVAAAAFDVWLLVLLYKANDWDD